MGAKCITALWISLTVLFTLALCFSFLSPVWFHNKKTTRRTPYQNSNEYDPASLGIIRYCHRYEMNQGITKCAFFTSLKTMPSIAWIISAIIYAVGIVFFVISVFLAFLSICVSRGTRDKMKIAAAYIQIIGVGFLAIGVLMFPLGLDSSFARDVCGLEAKMFVSDKCQVAWGYVLAIMAVSLTIFCPILAKYSTDTKEHHFRSPSYSDYEYSKSEVISLTTSSGGKVMTTV